MKLSPFIQNSSKHSPEMGITIHYYRNCGLPGELDKRNFSGTFTAEQLTVDIAQSLKISPLCFHLFSLATVDLSVWLAPNTLIECTGMSGVEYVFRMRIRPAKIEHLTQDQAAFAYFFLQCQNDFVNQCTAYDETVTRNEYHKQMLLLGQSVTGALCYVRELNINLDKLATLKLKLFTPSDIKNKFQKFVKKKQLRTNMERYLREEHGKSQTDSLSDIKLRYINGFLNITDQYMVERFLVSLDGDVTRTILVDICREKQQGLYFVQGAEEKDTFLCALDGLCGLNVSVDTLTVELLSDVCMPKLTFPSKPVLESFVSLLSKCYQLTTNFYEFFCKGNSPMMEELKRVTCHGPVQMGWAKKRLLMKHKEYHRYDHLLKQDCTDIGSYVLLYVSPKNRNNVESLDIVCLPSGALQLRVDDTATQQFADIATLLTYYRDDGHLGVPMTMCVPPAFPDDPHLLLCRNPSAYSSVTREGRRARVEVVMKVDTSEDLGQGHFTKVRKGRLPTVGDVAVKQLTYSDRERLLQSLQSAVQSASFWFNAHIIKVHAVVLAPQFQVVLEHAALGPLDAYLRHPHHALTVRDVMQVAEDVAKAIIYLEDVESGHGEIHGNIRCRNMLVCSHQPGRRLVVKLADPGLVHYYNRMSMHDDINAERFPWIAPECYASLKSVTKYSDRYAFGITVWELFSSGNHPYGQMTMEQIVTFVRQRHHLDTPNQCPPVIYHLMCLCWDLLPHERPSARTIVRSFIRFTRSANNDELLDQPLLTSTTSTSENMVSPSSMEMSDITNVRTMSAGLTSTKSISANMISSTGIHHHTAHLVHDVPHDSVQALRPDHNVSHDSPEILRPDHNAPHGSIQVPRPHHNVSQDSIQIPKSHHNIPHDLPQILKPDHNIPHESQQVPRPDHNVPHDSSQIPSLDHNVPHDSVQVLIPDHNVPHDSVQVLRPDHNVPHDSVQVLRPEQLQIHKDHHLGKGHYGDVYKGELKNADTSRTQTVAVKCLRAELYDKYLDDFEKEISIMQQLSHDNIVQIMGFLPHQHDENPLQLVMEYAANGCLSLYLKKQANNISQDRLLTFSEEIAKGMHYLHSKGVIHCDLAARNILVTSDVQLKIGDFGLAQVLPPNKEYYEGNPHRDIPTNWCAPQCLCKYTFSRESDVWSYGVVVWEIFSFGGKPSLSLENVPAIIKALHCGKRLKQPRFCPDDIFKLMYCCWKYKPEDRIQFGQILNRIHSLQSNPHSKGLGNELQCK